MVRKPNYQRHVQLIDVQTVPVFVQPVLPEQFTVVGGHDHQRTVEDAAHAERVDDTLKFGVEERDGPVVSGAQRRIARKHRQVPRR